MHGAKRRSGEHINIRTLLKTETLLILHLFHFHDRAATSNHSRSPQSPTMSALTGTRVGAQKYALPCAPRARVAKASRAQVVKVEATKVAVLGAGASPP